jgi:hypothetical protein
VEAVTMIGFMNSLLITALVDRVDCNTPVNSISTKSAAAACHSYAAGLKKLRFTPSPPGRHPLADRSRQKEQLRHAGIRAGFTTDFNQGSPF